MVSSMVWVSLLNGEVSVGTTTGHSAEGICRSLAFAWRALRDLGLGLVRINEGRDQKLSSALARYKQLSLLTISINSNPDSIRKPPWQIRIPNNVRSKRTTGPRGPVN